MSSGVGLPVSGRRVETVMAVSFCFPSILDGGALAVETATAVLADIFLMFLAAKIAGELFERLHQPAVIGEFLVGVILGPYALGWIGVPTAGMIAELHSEQIAAETMHSIMEVLAELGVIVLLFLVGLETRLSDILSVGSGPDWSPSPAWWCRSSWATPSWPSCSAPRPSRRSLSARRSSPPASGSPHECWPTSAASGRRARIILGAAVIDDILGMIVLAVVSALGQDAVSVGQIGIIAVQALAFTLFVALAGRHAARRWSLHLENLGSETRRSWSGSR